MVGAPPRGRVVIVDDVLTAGTALRESYHMLVAAGAEPVAAITALDRQEVGPSGRSAVAEASSELKLAILSLVTVREVLEFLGKSGGDAATIQAIENYQAQYGA